MSENTTSDGDSISKRRKLNNGVSSSSSNVDELAIPEQSNGAPEAEDDLGEDEEILDPDHNPFEECFRDASFLFSQDNIENLRNSFTSSSSSPFSHLQINDIFDQELIKSVKSQLVFSGAHVPHKSDLFSYLGTRDLSDPNQAPPNSPLSKLRDAIYSEHFVSFIERSTGVTLTRGKVDLSSHIYRRGDYLACHDDEIRDDEGSGTARRIAWILYLVDEDWSEKDGGQLELFDTNHQAEPNEVVKALVPKFNSIALFEVTPTSFHAVSQVLVPAHLASSRFRLSISGWFHGPLASRLSIRSWNTEWRKEQADDELFGKMINMKYLEEETVQEIREKFCDESGIELWDFFEKEYLDELLKNLEAAGWKEKKEGPPFLRRYSTLTDLSYLSNNPIFRIFSSSTFRSFLALTTGLSQERFLSHRIIPRKFSSGDYTLIHDHGCDPAPGLDVILSLGVGDDTEWDEQWGGATHYVSKDSSEEAPGREKEDLLTMWPRKNCLQVVMRDEMTLKFVDFVKCSINDIPTLPKGKGKRKANGDIKDEKQLDRGRMEIEVTYVLAEDEDSEEEDQDEEGEEDEAEGEEEIEDDKQKTSNEA